MKTLPTEQEIYSTFSDFFYFSFDLLGKIEPNNLNLKFAVVNMQIALELFLKYYFISQDKQDKIIKGKNDNIDFVDFSQILNFYFSQPNYSFGNKKELAKILEARNYIVHRGLKSGWNEEIALYLINCVYFIEGIIRYDFNSSLFDMLDYKRILSVANNTIWKKGVENFITTYSKNHKIDFLYCNDCNTNSFVTNNFFSFYGEDDEDSLQCLCCFTYIPSQAGKLLKCFFCNKKSFLTDILNPQDNQLYYGKCLSCDTKSFVRKCKNCDCYYHPNEKKEIIKNGKYFCSDICGSCEE